MTAVHWILIALEGGAGIVLTGIGMFAGLWTAAESDRPTMEVRPMRDITTVVGFTALYPTGITLLVGWLGPQPHGSFWLTVLAGIASAFAGCWLTLAGLAYREQGAGILAVIGVLLPACCTALVFNVAWLLPNLHFPAIDLI